MAEPRASHNQTMKPACRPFVCRQRWLAWVWCIRRSSSVASSGCCSACYTRRSSISSRSARKKTIWSSCTGSWPTTGSMMSCCTTSSCYCCCRVWLGHRGERDRYDCACRAHRRARMVLALHGTSFSLEFLFDIEDVKELLSAASKTRAACPNTNTRFVLCQVYAGFSGYFRPDPAVSREFLRYAIIWALISR